jgi:hypothetical protein
MRPLRYSINVTLDGCCDHRAGITPDEELHRRAAETVAQADALLFGRVIYQNDGGSVARAGAGGNETGVDGTVRSNHRREEEEFTAADPDGNLFRVFYDFATPERERAKFTAQ